MSIAVTNKPTGQAKSPLFTQLSQRPTPALRPWHLQLINLRFNLKLQAIAGAFWHYRERERVVVRPVFAYQFPSQTHLSLAPALLALCRHLI